LALAPKLLLAFISETMSLLRLTVSPLGVFGAVEPAGLEPGGAELACAMRLAVEFMLSNARSIPSKDVERLVILHFHPSYRQGPAIFENFFRRSLRGKAGGKDDRLLSSVER
jgi:hypothetical protein